jgi:hypothetical protein
MIRILNNDIREQVEINPISKETWLNHFQHLWSKQSEMLIQQQSSNKYTETASDTALKKENITRHLKNMDWILDPSKYTGKLFHKRFLQLLNTIWYGGTFPESWKEAAVILWSRYTKRSIKLLTLTGLLTMVHHMCLPPLLPWWHSWQPWRMTSTHSPSSLSALCLPSFCPEAHQLLYHHNGLLHPPYPTKQMVCNLK